MNEITGTPAPAISPQAPASEPRYLLRVTTQEGQDSSADVLGPLAALAFDGQAAAQAAELMRSRYPQLRFNVQLAADPHPQVESPDKSPAGGKAEQTKQETPTQDRTRAEPEERGRLPPKPERNDDVSLSDRRDAWARLAELDHRWQTLATERPALMLEGLATEARRIVDGQVRDHDPLMTLRRSQALATLVTRQHGDLVDPRLKPTLALLSEPAQGATAEPSSPSKAPSSREDAIGALTRVAANLEALADASREEGAVRGPAGKKELEKKEGRREAGSDHLAKYGVGEPVMLLDARAPPELKRRFETAVQQMDQGDYETFLKGTRLA
ncbi:hypothetical protein, partial [Azospirillum sp. B4]|uniref:hypothetical protein n=1 Tax=Azospirillum sp. B4 TaxID=95605 RepID=UPI0005CB7F0C